MNIPPIPVTELVSQFETSGCAELAEQNTPAIFVTELVSQFETSGLALLDRNILDIFVTLLTSHEPISELKSFTRLNCAGEMQRRRRQADERRRRPSAGS